MDQPDNHQPPEDCVVMQSMKGMWNDIPGGEKKKFICETVVFDKFRCNKGGCPIKHGYPGHRGVKVEPDIPGCCDGVTGGTRSMRPRTRHRWSLPENAVEISLSLRNECLFKSSIKV
ncbi:hypothetical protein ScPMuIL_018705 [Solemya velum]